MYSTRFRTLLEIPSVGKLSRIYFMSTPRQISLRSEPPSPSCARRNRQESQYHARGRKASTVHVALCMTGILLVILSGVLVVQHANMMGRGSSRALRVHRLLQVRAPRSVCHASLTYVRSAGGLIAGGTYFFMDNYESGSSTDAQGDTRDNAPGFSALMAYISSTQAGSANHLLLYILRCAFGSWDYHIPHPRARHAAGGPGFYDHPACVQRFIRRGSASSQKAATRSSG